MTWKHIHINSMNIFNGMNNLKKRKAQHTSLLASEATGKVEEKNERTIITKEFNRALT